MWQIFLSIFCLLVLTRAQQTPKDPPPQITTFLSHDLINPEQVKFRTDNAMILPCAATGSNLKWRWQHNNTDIPEGELEFGKRRLSPDGTLTGSNLGISDSGTYQCFVKDTATNVETFSRKVKVAVTVVGEFIDTSSSTRQVDLGSAQSFPCPAHQPSYGVSFTWIGKDQIQFKRNDRRGIAPNGDLFIMYVLPEDVLEINGLEGIKCTMSGANTFYSGGSLTLTTPQGQTDPGTNSGPSWSVRPGNTEIAVEGRNKTLYCLALGRPAPEITWKKNGVQLSHGGEYDIPQAFEGRLLNIIQVRKDLHEDTYSCEAENTENTGNPIVHNINLIVEVAPRWVSGEPPSRERIDINGNGTLTCEVFAIPMPQRIVWYRDGNEITTSTAQVIPQGNKLLFKQVRLNEAGIYQCVAENTHGMVVSSTYVEVVAIAPSFQKRGFGPFYIFNGTRGELECNPEAAPRPSVFKWFKDGSELTGGRYSVHADGTLVINKVDRRRDEGTYECYAENFLGNARASAGATVLQPTKIIRSPRNVTVLEGARVDLICEAEADPSLELRYYWKRDNAEIEYSRKIQWLEDQNVLTIADITVDDAGLYTCVAYTPEPKRSEDSASATVDISGVPDPPLAVELSSDCYNRSTSLKWITGASNNATITHFLIEEKSSYGDDYWRVIAEVTNPNATSSALVNMTGWATLFYRVRAVNRFGPSRPSLPTTSLCRTMQGRPDKWPDNLRGVPGKAEELDIAWKAMPMVEWNAPGLYYILFYGRVGEDFVDTKIADPTVDRFNVNNPGYYIEWQFRIQAGNDVALGDISPIVRAFSGQDPPQGRPENVAVGAVTARTVELSWNPVTVTRGSVDGYRIYYWGESRIQAKRRRRAIPAYATSTNVTGGNTQRHTVTDLKPYYSYNFALKAFNSGGEGPASDEVPANTQEAEPGPPAEVNVYAFAKYILVTWQQPLEPNGIITNYRVGSKQYSGSIPTDEVEMTEVGPEVRRMLLENRTPEEYYVVQIQAKTSIGWGESVRKTTRTVQWSAPAKPARPTVEGIAVDKVRVTYNFGLGGGYTHEFLVMYRKKLAGEQFQNTSWVDHFQVQNIEIGDLSPDLYEFKTVGRNDYPSGGNTESPASDVVEGRPLPGVVNAGKRATTPIHKTAWFIALLVLIAILLLVLLIFVLYTRHQGAKYPVGKREKKRAALIENEPFDEEEGAFANAGRTENPPPYQSEGSLQKGPDSDRDSLDDYGEGPQFNEDGSFIGEYGDEKKGASDEKDPNALATFV